MKTQELWSEIIPKPKDSNSVLTNQISVAVVGDAILVYDSNTGELQNKPIRGAHKEQINQVAFSKDGKRFATCGNDRNVIIWQYSPQNTPRVQAEVKYQQAEQVYCLAFNPLTSQIFSGGAADYGLWTPDQSNVEKNKTKEKINCCAWSADGLFVAYGTMNGTIKILTRKLEEKISIQRSSPIWCMTWTPITQDFQESELVVGAWDQSISFYKSTGQQEGHDKKLTFDPLSIDFYPNGKFYLISGTNKKASLYSRNGGFLIDVCTKNDWIWSAKLRSKDMFALITTNDGQISQYKIIPLPVSALYNDIYAFRDTLTDVIVQDIGQNTKIRIKCKELVKGVSIYKDKLATYLNDKVLVYIQDKEMKTGKGYIYRQFKRISKKLDCEQVIILSNNLIAVYKKKIQLYYLDGVLEREWVLESRITSAKCVGGMEGKENILLGLHNGNVLKLCIDSSFPIVLSQHNISITGCDLSLDKKRLAYVDKNKNMTVIDVITKETIYQEMNVTSCSFNSDYNDMIAYSGNEMLFIRTGSFPPLSQKMSNSSIVGFRGNKLFLQSNNILNTIDVSQTTTMLKYVEKKDLTSAFQVACLGITNQDFKALGIEALAQQHFEIAKKCFQRIQDFQFIELVERFQFDKERNQLNEVELQGEILAYQEKFQDAEKHYIKHRQADLAIEMYKELRDFENAKRVSQSIQLEGFSNPNQRPGSTHSSRPSTVKSEKFPEGKRPENMLKLIKEEAEWKAKNGEWREAGKLYLQSGDFKKAIDVYTQNNFLEGLIDVCRQMDPMQHQAQLQACAYQFRKNKHHAYAKETYLKLNDQKSLIALHIEMEKWEDALLLGKQDPSLMEMVKLPYADYLSKMDRYDEALRAYKSLGRHDLTTNLLSNLTKNAVAERRFDSASYYYWILATENLKLVKNARQPKGSDLDYLRSYEECLENAEIYYAYHKVHQYVEEPFNNTGMGYLLQVFNSARMAICKLKNKNLYGVKQGYIYYTLGKLSKVLEMNKTARTCFEKLPNYKIPAKWAEEMELFSLLIISKPFSDKEDLLPICNRCMNANVIVSNGYYCTSCQHPFIASFISFENLPLVEFKVEPGISHNKVLELLNSEKQHKQTQKKKKKNNDGWKESVSANEQVLSMVMGGGADQDDIDSSPFMRKVKEVFEAQLTTQDYLPLVLDQEIIRTLEPDEVYFVDLTRYCPSMEIKYYKMMVNDVPLKNCTECGKFFLLDEYEFEYLRTKKCPFCKTLDKREGLQKDIFEY